MDLQMLFGIAIGSFIMVLLVHKLKEKLSSTINSGSHTLFINNYINYVSNKQWAIKCIDKNEVFEEGQMRLWSSVKRFHDKMDKIALDNFKINLVDKSIMSDVFDIISTVHFMQAAEEDKLDYNNFLILEKK